MLPPHSFHILSAPTGTKILPSVRLLLLFGLRAHRYGKVRTEWAFGGAGSKLMRLMKWGRVSGGLRRRLSNFRRPPHCDCTWVEEEKRGQDAIEQ